MKVNKAPMGISSQVALLKRQVGGLFCVCFVAFFMVKEKHCKN